MSTEIQKLGEGKNDAIAVSTDQKSTNETTELVNKVIDSSNNVPCAQNDSAESEREPSALSDMPDPHENVEGNDITGTKPKSPQETAAPEAELNMNIDEVDSLKEQIDEPDAAINQNTCVNTESEESTESPSTEDKYGNENVENTEINEDFSSESANKMDIKINNANVIEAKYGHANVENTNINEDFGSKTANKMDLEINNGNGIEAQSVCSTDEQTKTANIVNESKETLVLSEKAQHEASSGDETYTYIDPYEGAEDETERDSKDANDSDEDRTTLNVCLDALRELTDKVAAIDSKVKRIANTEDTTKTATASSSNLDDNDAKHRVDKSETQNSDEIEIKEEPVTPTDETADKAYQVLAIWSKIADASGDASSDVLYDLITQKLKDDQSKESRAIATELISTLEGVKQQEKSSNSENETIKETDAVGSDISETKSDGNKDDNGSDCNVQKPSSFDCDSSNVLSQTVNDPQPVVQAEQKQHEQDKLTDTLDDTAHAIKPSVHPEISLISENITGQSSSQDTQTSTRGGSISSENKPLGNENQADRAISPQPRPQDTVLLTDSLSKCPIEPRAPANQKQAPNQNTTSTPAPIVIDLDSQPVVSTVPKTPAKQAGVEQSQPIVQTPPRPVPGLSGPHPAAIVKSPGVQRNVGTPRQNRSRPPVVQPRQQVPASTPTKKKSFIENLIATGIPIVIPDDDETPSASTGRSPAPKPKQQTFQHTGAPNVRREHLPTTPQKETGPIRSGMHSPPGAFYSSQTGDGSLGGFRSTHVPQIPQYLNPNYSLQHSPVAAKPPRVQSPSYKYNEPFVGYPQQVTPKKNVMPAAGAGQSPSFGSPRTPTGQGSVPRFPQTPPTSIQPVHAFSPSQLMMSPSGQRRANPQFSPGSEYGQQHYVIPRNPNLQQFSPRAGHLTEARRRNRQQKQSTSAQKLKSLSGTTIVIDEDRGNASKVMQPGPVSSVPFSPPVQTECLPVISNVTSMAIAEQDLLPPMTETFDDILKAGPALNTSPQVNKPAKRSRSEEMLKSSIEYMRIQPAKRQMVSLSDAAAPSSTQPLHDVQGALFMQSPPEPASEAMASLDSLNAMCQDIQNSQSSEVTKAASAPEVVIDIDVDENKEALRRNLNLDLAETAEKPGDTQESVAQVPDSASDADAKRPADNRGSQKSTGKPDTEDESKSSGISKGKRKGKTLSCEDCDEKFPTKTALKVHMKKHKAAKPFACDVCGKQFSQKAYLTKHIYTHFQEQDK